MLAGVLALVALAGLVAALVPANVPLTPDECSHESARLVKESGDKKTYYCPECNERFERVLRTDTFPNNLYEFDGNGGIAFVGNFEIGDFIDGSYQPYNGTSSVIDVNDKEVWLFAHGAVGAGQSSGWIVEGGSCVGGFCFGSEEYEPAIVWTAPQDCAVSISFKRSHCVCEGGPYFDLSVLHNDSPVTPSAEKIRLTANRYLDLDGLNAIFEDEVVNVKAGEKIIFKFSHVEGQLISGVFPIITYVS